MGTFNTALPSPNTDNIYRLGDNTEYYYDLILYNANEEFVRLKTQGVKELIINDNLLDFYHKGTLIFRNDIDAIEKITTEPNGTSQNSFGNNFAPSKGGQNTLLPFAFRGDCRDYLIVDICPKLNDQINYNYGEQLNKLWRLKFVFAIYDIEDITGQTIDEKYKKLHFWDYSYQIMTEKNLDFSTATFTKAEDKVNLDDSERTMKTGAALKEIINATFPSREGFTIKFGEFDEGSTDIFYSSPIASKALSDYQYIDSFHVSSPSNNYDFSLLRKERFTNEWTYKSLKNYFDNAYEKKVTNNLDGGGPLHLEKFLVGSYSDSNSTNYTNVSRTPVSSKNNAYLPDYSQIQKYRFFPTAGNDVQNFITTNQVHAYDSTEKEFIIDVQENDFTRILDIFETNYVRVFKGNATGPFSTLTKNEYRRNNRNYNTDYNVSTSRDQRLSAGRNEVLKKALFLNNTINFTAPGLTMRQAGRFISIDRDSSQPSNKFDDKFLGTYFVVEVNHVFRGNIYETEMTCVKPYIFSDPKNVEDVI
jgi:hypothetical protein